MPEPWTLDHKVTWFAQIRTRPGPPDVNGERWAENEHTGLVLAVCNCGLNTGWIPKADMPDQAALDDGEQHAALTWTPAEEQDLTNARQLIAALLRDLAPGHPVTRIWGRRSTSTAEQGQDGNAWAADPEDIADLVVNALTGQALTEGAVIPAPRSDRDRDRQAVLGWLTAKLRHSYAARQREALLTVERSDPPEEDTPHA